MKRGRRDALEVLGFDVGVPVVATEMSVEPAAIAIGETVTISAVLAAERSIRASIDYIIHHQGVRGPKAGKVFKLKIGTLGPEPTSITKSHTFKHVSIRTIHPGPHKIELQVNGTVVGQAFVEIGGS